MLTQAIKETYRGHIITATLNDDNYSYSVAVNSTTYNDEVACDFLDDTFADIMTDIDDGICY